MDGGLEQLESFDQTLASLEGGEGRPPGEKCLSMLFPQKNWNILSQRPWPWPADLEGASVQILLVPAE